MQLTKNFSLEELIKSDIGIRNNISNTPNAQELKNLTLLAINVLQPIRNHYNSPVMINSAFRSTKLNALVKGAANSDHCFGMAADIEVVGIDNRELALWIKRSLEFKQLILEFYTVGTPDSGWVHVSYDTANLKRECLTAVKQNSKTVYLPGITK